MVKNSEQNIDAYFCQVVSPWLVYMSSTWSQIELHVSQKLLIITIQNCGGGAFSTWSLEASQFLQEL